MPNYLKILQEELILALGCTEPIAIALAAAHAGALTGEKPETIDVYASGSIIKNANSVYVPHSGGRQGVLISAALGAVAAAPELKLRAAYPGLPANANSMVTLWDLDGVSLLNTGDIGAEYSQYLGLSAQVMKLPHHGSRHDATQALITRVSPEVALITASGTQPERYQAAGQRLLEAGAAYLITGETGAVTLTIQDGQAHVTGHLEGGTIHGL